MGPSEVSKVMQTMRCKHCGADYCGGRCMYCGSNEFVDVSDLYNPENVVFYQGPSPFFCEGHGRRAKARSR